MLCAATVMTTAVERDVWLEKKLWKTPFAEKRSEKISQTWKILSDNFNIPASPRSACRWSPFRDSISKSSGKIFPSRFALHVEWVLSWRRFSFFPVRENAFIVLWSFSRSTPAANDNSSRLATSESLAAGRQSSNSRRSVDEVKPLVAGYKRDTLLLNCGKFLVSRQREKSRKELRHLLLIAPHLVLRPRPRLSAPLSPQRRILINLSSPMKSL